MEAAFVEIGLEKNGFLYVDEIVGPELEGRKGARKIQDLIKRGETVLVQAVKDPMKSKGARLTTEISLPGRFLVYVPNGEGSGVSRRLEDARAHAAEGDRQGPRPEGRRHHRPHGRRGRVRRGHRARPRLPAAPVEDDPGEDEGRDGADARLRGGGAPAADRARPLRRRLRRRADRRRPHASADRQLPEEDVAAHDRARPPLPREGAALRGVRRRAEIRSTLERRVDLPSGGYLVFDYAEAFTVIDVNTGRFVGSRGKSAPGRLEDTIVKNNLEAVKEVVRQLRLRDIGGIIVIDFIDMSNPKNRETVEEALRTELERDRTKTYVVEISPLGLVEMTRQNVTDGPREILTTKCAVCEGDGFVVSEATHALEIERRLRALAKGLARAGVPRRRASARPLAPRRAGRSRLEAIEAAARRRFFLVPAAENGHVHLDHFEVLEQGKLDTLRPAAPFEEGASLELKLVEVGLYDPTAGVGKVDGWNGRRLGRGEARREEGLRRPSAACSTAPRTRRSPTTRSRPTPITFEAEAEKPTRAPRGEEGGAAGRRARAGRRGRESSSRGRRDRGRGGGRRGADVAEDEPSADGTPKKKRTRRGTRGGRGRKKPSAPARPKASDASPADDNGRPAPRIHVPPLTSTTAGDTEPIRAPRPTSAEETSEPRGRGGCADGAPKRKRSRRGSRGGRKRKKPVAAHGDRGGRRRTPEPRMAAEADVVARTRPPSQSARTRVSRVRSDVGMDRGLREPQARIAAIMRRFCGPSPLARLSEKHR